MRLLVLTHTFLPSRRANAKRPYYVVRAFLEAGWEVDVITSLLGLAAGAGESLIHPALRVFRYEHPGNRLQRWFGSYPHLLRRATLVLAGTTWPDESVTWSVKALRMTGKMGAYDRVLVSVFPPSLLLAGLRSKLASPNWVYDYQESVTPYFRKYPRRSPMHGLLFRMLQRIERRTLHRTGRVIFTAATNREAYIREGLVPEANTAHIPYFYDADVFRGAKEAVADRFEISYFGTFDWRGDRSPETFLRALARFLGEHPKARPRTRFSFYGAWLSEHKRYLEELRLQDMVILHPPLAYDAYVAKLKQSPVLLLVVSAAHNLFMPSKIVDYFGARRPILAFVPPEAEMRQVLEDAGMAEFTCCPSDIGQGSQVLEKLWNRYCAGSLGCDTKKTAFWSSEVQIPRYLKAVTDLQSSV